MTTEKPYLEEQITTTVRRYNPNYGDDRVCQCGHTYYRHFDSWADMDNVGCKYCWCHDFQEAVLTPEQIENMTQVVREKYPDQFRDIDEDRMNGFLQIAEFHERLLELYFLAQYKE